MNDYESAKRLARVLYTYYESRGDAENAVPLQQPRNPVAVHLTIHACTGADNR